MLGLLPAVHLRLAVLCVPACVSAVLRLPLGLSFPRHCPCVPHSMQRKEEMAGKELGTLFPTAEHTHHGLPSHWALRSSSLSLDPSDKHHVLVSFFKILGENFSC